MLALAEILALIVLNALIQTAFARWKLTRRANRSRPPGRTRLSLHYPQHPSPVANAARSEMAPEHAAHIRPAGIDW